MSIFSRFKDIVSSNISSMLDKAEDPEKLIRLMLREMEETLVELKAGCAATMAEAAKARRSLDEAAEETAQWEHRAELALRAGVRTWRAKLWPSGFRPMNASVA